ncbi:hypothetical protein ABL78_1769 [Leptomonas seymouri]|uniref:Uncharacterized protein n=1 Tax=Leptomonas seymouri TaxID=5684 RepID=A0A0N1PES7_LEPSE|nr:hypothetical protein ABL78_1769 [Leptomonas seymouri]|eukprot:KPI89125.1 hypothetical protein ABL78_1769 [Leptomonas seymouri]
MEAFPPQEQFLQERRTSSLWKKQEEFVRFLVNAYYVEPSKIMEKEKRSTRSGAFSDLLCRDFSFGDDIAQIIGRIAEEVALLGQKHVQDKPPFSILEKPLLVPAMIGSLLQFFFIEMYGVFISSTTFDSWASRALGFEIRLSRVWLEAEYRVYRALLNSNAKRLVTQRSARETGVHAIHLQSQNGGSLHLLWNITYRLLCTKFSVEHLRLVDVDKLFLQAIENSITLRKNLEEELKSPSSSISSVVSTFYAVAEPELCSCIAYHSCFRAFESIFKKETNTRDKKMFSADIMQAFFHECLNAFTFNRYDDKKLTSVFETLDAVALLADGKHIVTRQNLAAAGAPTLPTYLQRAQLLSCDLISREIASSTKGIILKSSIIESTKFTEMDTTAIDINAVYSFGSVELLEHESKTERDGKALIHNSVLNGCDDQENYSKFTTLLIEGEGDDCAKYILSEKERTAKKQIYQKMYSHKRQRTS